MGSYKGVRGVTGKLFCADDEDELDEVMDEDDRAVDDELVAAAELSGVGVEGDEPPPPPQADSAHMAMTESHCLENPKP